MRPSEIVGKSATAAREAPGEQQDAQSRRRTAVFVVLQRLFRTALRRGVAWCVIVLGVARPARLKSSGPGPDVASGLHGFRQARRVPFVERALGLARARRDVQKLHRLAQEMEGAGHDQERALLGAA